MPILYGEKLERVKIATDVICDRCGDSCKKPMNFEFAKIEARWGYESKKDAEHHLIYLCESCYDWIVAQAALKPTVEESI